MDPLVTFPISRRRNEKVKIHIPYGGGHNDKSEYGSWTHR